MVNKNTWEVMGQKLWDSFKEDDNGCWIWQGFLDKGGYGQIRWDGKNQRAHRMMYEYQVDDIPEGMLIRHLCGVASCINPDHLTPGTHSENALDWRNKSRTL